MTTKAPSAEEDRDERSSWERLQDDVRTSSAALGRAWYWKRSSPGVMGLLASLYQRDLQEARDKILEEVYEVEATGKNPQRVKYLLGWAGAMR
jgi:hypothetical protein